MASLAATCSPNSYQLLLAISSRKNSSSGVFLRIRSREIDHRVRLFSVSSGSVTNSSVSETERRRVGDSWLDSSSSFDDFAGWSASNGSERSTDSQKKPSLLEILGAGLTGLILVAGFTFAALSITRLNISRQKRLKETTTAQEDVAFPSNELLHTVEEDKTDDRREILESSNLQRKTGMEKDSLYMEYNEAVGHDNDSEHISSDADVIKNISIQQEDIQNESTIDSMSTAPEPIQKVVKPSSGVNSFASLSSEHSDGSAVSVSSELPSVDNQKSFVSVHHEGMSSPEQKENSNITLESSSSQAADSPLVVASNQEVNSQLEAVLEHLIVPSEVMETSSSLSTKDFDLANAQEIFTKDNKFYLETHKEKGDMSSEVASASTRLDSSANRQDFQSYNDIHKSQSTIDSKNSESLFTSIGIPAPIVVSPDLQLLPGKVLVPAVVDQVQGQAFAALQVLKVIETDVQPGDLCTRREYARWLVSASSALTRNTISKVYPAMYIENVTELAFDDVTPEDPDFTSIQGLAEAGLISSKLSRRDMNLSDEDTSPIYFFPESPLSRQDLVSWKMALETSQLPVAHKKDLCSFIDMDKINQDAWPAILADLSVGEQGIITLAFGYTKLFQPHKPVTKAQAAIAISTGEASEIVGEELERIEAESMAEKAVSAHNALVAQVEKELNASFENKYALEREKIDFVEKLAEEARRELEKLRAEREEENIALMKERAAVDSEMEVLSKLRYEVEEQLQSLMSKQVEISYEKERVDKLQKDAEIESQEIARLHYELEVERKALAMARAWAEDEAKRAREQAKALEVARDRWERHGIKVVVDSDLREDANAGVTWLTAGKEFSVEGTVNRAENLVDKLKAMAEHVRGKSRDIIYKVIQKILLLVSALKEWASNIRKQTGELKDAAMSKVGGSLQELQQRSAKYSVVVKEVAMQVAGDCREGIEKFSQKFKTGTPFH